jgi:hypothetical protein
VSDDLKSALRTMKYMSETMETPLIYLHDPETGEAFAAMIDLTLVADVVDPDNPDAMAHGHLEGTEDEDPSEQ